MATQTANATQTAKAIQPKTKAVEPASGGEAQSAAVTQYRWLILLGLISAAIMEVLDSTIVNVALPQMAGNGCIHAGDNLGFHRLHSRQRGLSPDDRLSDRDVRQAQLPVSIHRDLHRRLLSVRHLAQSGRDRAVAHPARGWRRGPALDGTGHHSADLPGKGAGHRAAYFLLGIIVADFVPYLGGWITDNYTWNWCFFINIPIGLMAVALVFTLLQDPPGMVKGKTTIHAALPCWRWACPACNTCWKRGNRTTGLTIRGLFVSRSLR